MQVKYCYRMLFSVAFVFLLSAILPASVVAGEDPANANAQAAGERAHFAQEYCGTSPERIGEYKERIRKVLHDASNFDQYWQTGWRRGEHGDIQLNAMRLNDPKEFAARIKTSCDRIRWMAQNAARDRPRK